MKLDTSKAPAMKSYAVTNSFNGTLSATSDMKQTIMSRSIYTHRNDLKTGTTGKLVNNDEMKKKKQQQLYDTSS